MVDSKCLVSSPENILLHIEICCYLFYRPMEGRRLSEMFHIFLLMLAKGSVFLLICIV